MCKWCNLFFLLISFTLPPTQPLHYLTLSQLLPHLLTPFPSLFTFFPLTCLPYTHPLTLIHSLLPLPLHTYSPTFISFPIHSSSSTHSFPICTPLSPHSCSPHSLNPHSVTLPPSSPYLLTLFHLSSHSLTLLHPLSPHLHTLPHSFLSHSTQFD